jgi:hypothetical protein
MFGTGSIVDPDQRNKPPGSNFQALPPSAAAARNKATELDILRLELMTHLGHGAASKSKPYRRLVLSPQMATVPSPGDRQPVARFSQR